MGVFAIEALAIWSLVSFLAGLAMGAAIRKGARAQKDEFLACVFSTLENLQDARFLNSPGA